MDKNSWSNVNERYKSLKYNITEMLNYIEELKQNLTNSINQFDNKKDALKLLNCYKKLYSNKKKLSEYENKLSAIKKGIKINNRYSNDLKSFVSFDCAKELKNVNCNIPCFALYDENGLLTLKKCAVDELDIYGLSKFFMFNLNTIYQQIEAPLLMDAVRWLISKHEIVVSAFIKEPFAKPLEYIYSIQSPKFGLDNYSAIVSDKEYSSYEEALNSGIMEALKHI